MNGYPGTDTRRPKHAILPAASELGDGRPPVQHEYLHRGGATRREDACEEKESGDKSPHSKTNAYFSEMGSFSAIRVGLSGRLIDSDGVDDCKAATREATCG